jgi:uncharacterized sulfatase
MENSRPNILWITVDSVRADHTTLHGYHRETTPELDRIASSKKGVRFEHGIAHSTRTPVFVPSVMTGLYPSQHQLLGKRSGHLIPESLTTAPELFAESGYRTIGVSENSYAGEAKGLDERFDEFVGNTTPTLNLDSLLSHDGMMLGRYILNAREHGPGLTLDRTAHKDQRSFFTTEVVKRKLRNASSTEEPFFCYVHYNDVHHAYLPPMSYRSDFIGETDATAQEAIEFARDMHENLYEYIAEGIPFTETQWEMLRAMYDAIIKYVDSCVGSLFDFVQNQIENTIVVITADHGDLFGEEGLLGHHIVLHDGLIHVPLVVHGLDGIDQCTQHPTQHIDVMQTLLSVAGADTSQFRGYTLTEECRDIAISQDLRGTVDDDDAQNYERIRKYNPDIDLSHLPVSLLTSVRTADYKLLHTEEWTKLYRLPNESTDVKENEPNVYKELLTFVQNWLDSEGQPLDITSDKGELSDETEQQLRDMGYL